MAAVWEQRFTEYVRRALSLRESTALEALPDLMPVLPVIDPSAPDLALLRRERPYVQSLSQAAVAAQYPRLRWGNAAASANCLAIIERVLLWSSTAQDIEVLIATGWGNGPSAAGPRDLRGVSATSPVNARLNTAADTTAGAPTVFPVRVYLQANVQREVALGFVLPPSSYVAFTGSVVNSPLTASLFWSERTVDAAELNPTGA